MKNLQSYFKVLSKDTKILAFGKKQPNVFNYVDFFTNESDTFKSTTSIEKQMNNSFVLNLQYDLNVISNIKELKLTNQELITWEDYWIDESKRLVDPLIERVNLQKNKFFHANFNLPRKELKSINLEGNENLRALLIYSAPKLEELDISNCPSVDLINLGDNSSIKKLLARNCKLSEFAQQSLLGSLTPVVTSSSNATFSMFRKNFETVLDLRGNDIVWTNRKIASKIRLLLCNNWMVLWDNPPPTSIIPPQMYAVFLNNLSDSLIKEYYG